MSNISKLESILSEVNMQKIDIIISELKTIMQENDITQTHVVSLLDGKCARNTILSFFKGDADCRLSTLLMILDACGVELRMETERSKQALLSSDISSYRVEFDKMRLELEEAINNRDFFKSRYEELIDKNTSLTNTIEKQQGQIEKYMERMEHAEEALYRSNADSRRKDEKIVELLKEAGRW